MSPDLQTVKVLRGGQEFALVRCSYVASGERCGYAGTICDSTSPCETTRWWCRFHFECKDAHFGALVVEQSHGRGEPVRKNNHARRAA